MGFSVKSVKAIEIEGEMVFIGTRESSIAITRTRTKMEHR